MLKIDVKDRKILYELSVNARQTFTSIGKKVRLHKDTVAYRMKQLERQGVISGYTMFYNFASLGYQVYKLYVQLQGMKEDDTKKLQAFFIQHSRVGWVVHCTGTWDLIVGVLARSVREFYDFKHTFESTNHEFIAKVATTTHVEAYFYPRNYLTGSKESGEVTIFKEAKPARIDGKDKEILKLLSENARMPSTEIAQKLHLTARTVAYRIKQLEKNGVILQYRCSMNLEKIGYTFFKTFITLQRLTKEKQRQLLAYCRAHPNIIHNVECLGNWDIEPEFEVENTDVFYRIIKDMRSKFSDIIKSVETVIIEQEHKYKYVPFG